MKRTLLSLAGGFLFLFASSQNHPPVAVNDTAEVISQVPTLIDALANDYDPDGDGFFINTWYHYHVPGIDTINGMFYYKASAELGLCYDFFDYTLKDTVTPPVISSPARIIIRVLENPHAPLAVPDTFEIPALVPVIVDVLSNDTDLEEDDLKIEKIYSKEHCAVVINEDSVTLTVTPNLTGDSIASFSYRIVERNTSEKLRSFTAPVMIRILDNPDIPVINPDTAYATGGVPLFIPVLENDYDPQGDEIEIRTVSNPLDCQAEIQDNGVIFTAPGGMQKEVIFSYMIQEINDPEIHSNYSYVTVFVTKNPGCPVGVPDFASGTTAIPMTIDLLSNDYDPEGDSLEILDVETNGDFTITGHSILYTSNPLKIGYDTLLYRVSQVNNSTFYSDWTLVYIDLATNPDLPVAVEDHYTVTGSIPLVFNPLVNDIRNAADSLVAYPRPSSNGIINRISDSTFEYIAYGNSSGHDVVQYLIRDKSDIQLSAASYIYLDIVDQHFHDSLTINNIVAGVNGDGMLFSNTYGPPGMGPYGGMEAQFRYPANATTQTIFNSLLWMGGLSEDDSIHFAGELYRQLGDDYQPGPVSSDYNTNYKMQYWKIWKLNKLDIEYHVENWWKAGYEPIRDIATWPGNGDESLGQAAQLAPYFDYDQDSIYDPMKGDYPLIRGDQSVFFIYNDDKEHTEMLGIPVKAEIHGMVYGFNEPSDSALWNTVFVHYDIYNRSENIYHDFYIGNYTDFDLGNFWDDYIGSDVSRSSFYCYNGDDYDETFIDDLEQPIYGYGNFPPAQSVTVLAGPYLEPDGLDNPAGGCDYSVNGSNFGNGTADDERMGLCGFYYFMPEYFYSMWPYTPEDCHNLVQGIWEDGSHCGYGGWGHMFFDPAYAGPECSFMYPGDSDPMNWGTGCISPNSGYNQGGFFWTDSSSGDPGDRRGLGTIGPLTFAPGQRLELDLAYCAANGWNGPASSIVQLMENIDTLRARVSRGEIIGLDTSPGVKEKPKVAGSLRIYPNPAGDMIRVDMGECAMKGEYYVYTVLGDVVGSGQYFGGSPLIIDINRLSPGFYIISVETEKGIVSGKFVKE